MVENTSLKSSKSQPTIEEVPVKTTPKPSAAASTPPSLTNGITARQHIQFRSPNSFRNRPHSMVETSKSRLVSLYSVQRVCSFPLTLKWSCLLVVDLLFTLHLCPVQICMLSSVIIPWSRVQILFSLHIVIFLTDVHILY